MDFKQSEESEGLTRSMRAIEQIDEMLNEIERVPGRQVSVSVRIRMTDDEVREVRGRSTGESPFVQMLFGETTNRDMWVASDYIRLNEHIVAALCKALLQEATAERDRLYRLITTASKKPQ